MAVIILMGVNFYRYSRDAEVDQMIEDMLDEDIKKTRADAQTRCSSGSSSGAPRARSYGGEWIRWL